MQWTEAQQKTIDIRDQNILVSAAAGSGKTAVLIERIKQLIIRDKVSIDRFLITTFTNAASAEMKERLEKAIRGALEQPGADRVFLKKQLALMPSANISTFHTFALEIMRRFFYVTDLEPGFKIGDDIEISIMKSASADELFEGRFADDYEEFTAFLKKYSSDRNERKLKSNLISLYDEMRSVPDYKIWARERTALLASASPSKALGLIAFIAEECAAGVNAAAGYYEKAAALLEEEGIESLMQKAQQNADMAVQWAERMTYARDAEETVALFQQFRESLHLNQMRAAKAEQEAYDLIKEQVTALRKQGKKTLDDLIKKYFQRTIAEYDEELRANYQDTVYLIGLLEELEVIFCEKKREKNMVDFDDVMHYAAEILKDEKAAAEYRDKFQYIFIDEFQDSNMLQELIAGRICRENNLFMVGDVKQSIYKFRLAEPEIFQAKYALYRQETETDSVAIDLNSNFRSKRLVTEPVNAVFEVVMAGYGETERLHCTMPEEYPGYMPQIHIIDTMEREDDLLENPQLEARQILQVIKEQQGREIYDAKEQKMRPLTYGDMVVLCRSRAMIGEIERFLNNAGVPAYGENTGEYFETVEVQVFINLLKIIDNSRQDVPLISVMRSPVFGFDVKELAAIRIFHRDGAYHAAVRHYGEDGSEDGLREKIAAMLAQISYWKNLQSAVSLEELVRILLYDTGYFDYCSGLPVAKQRIANLQLLVERAAAFEQNSSSGLYGFLSYIDAMKRSRLQVGEAKCLHGTENVVRVMTIHKSKGLEFPMVILAGAGKTIKFKGVGGPASMHKDLAIGLPFVNRIQQWHRKTLLQRVIEGKKAREELEEEIRILYVAMTRAMDRLAVTGVCKDAAKLEEGVVGGSSYLEMIYEPLREWGAEIVVHGSTGEGFAEPGSSSAKERLAVLFERSRQPQDEETLRMIDARLSFRYPYADWNKVKSKYSVTELNKMEKDVDRRTLSLAGPAFSQGERCLDAAQIGTAMHLVMEKLDFLQALKRGTAYVEEKVAGLLQEGTLSEPELQAIEVEHIVGFFTDEVGKRAALAMRLEKEREFILRKEIDGAEAIVQGIIDCYFEEDDGLVLIDYKNSAMGGTVDEGVIRERYRRQIELYKEALEGAEMKPVKETYLYLFEWKRFVAVD